MSAPASSLCCGGARYATCRQWSLTDCVHCKPLVDVLPLWKLHRLLHTSRPERGERLLTVRGQLAPLAGLVRLERLQSKVAAEQIHGTRSSSRRDSGPLDGEWGVRVSVVQQCLCRDTKHAVGTRGRRRFTRVTVGEQLSHRSPLVASAGSSSTGNSGSRGHVGGSISR